MSRMLSAVSLGVGNELAVGALGHREGREEDSKWALQRILVAVRCQGLGVDGTKAGSLKPCRMSKEENRMSYITGSLLRKLKSLHLQQPYTF